jgi:hypothetical protein
MQFPDGLPQAVDPFPYIVLGLIVLAALAGRLRRSRKKE